MSAARCASLQMAMLLAVLLAFPAGARAELGVTLSETERRIDDELRDRSGAYGWDRLLAPPRFDTEHFDAEHFDTEIPPTKIPPEQHRLFGRELLRRVGAPSSTPFDLLDDSQGSLSSAPWWRIVDGPEAYGGSWPEFQQVPLPWDAQALDFLAQQVARFSLKEQPTGKLPQPFYRGRRPVRWNEADGGHLILAGPAVKDGVATYRTEGSDTRIRIPLYGIDSARELYRWARHHGLAIKTALQRNMLTMAAENGPEFGQNTLSAYPPFPPIVAQTRLPAWIVQPGGLLPARIAAFSTGAACSGGSWLELVIDGNGQPPVWAVLLSSQEDLVKDARVRRLAARPVDARAYGEGQRSEIEVFWPDTLPALRLVARRFDFTETVYDEDAEEIKPKGERILGSAWGVQIFDANTLDAHAKKIPAKDAYLERPPSITASGTPRCAPP